MKLPFLFFLFFFSTLLHAQNAPNVWDVLRQRFILNHEVSQPAVQNQIRWLVAHPSYIQKVARQSEPYIYHIVTEIKKRNLPGELALIPMIESSYDPFAYSGAGAAGLWQLMPGTGTDLGLKQDWWFDGRRSIRPSTDAALNYLTYLHNFFNGDWLLAFAAYDAGEGAVSKIIKNSGLSGQKIRFWALNLPQETRAYIPRLLALAEVIQYRERFHIQLPHIPHIPYFEEVPVAHQIDLNHAAKLAGISYKDLIKLNPGFNRWATAPHQPFKLLVPANKAADFIRKLALSPNANKTDWMEHQVLANDSLNDIAERYHTTVRFIKNLNQLQSNQLKTGQKILIPKPQTPPPPSSTEAPAPKRFIALGQLKRVHIVQKNEDYAALQRRYGVRKEEIQRWNHLESQKPLVAGQALIIWHHPVSPKYYVVQRGDSLSKIARRHQTKISTLLRLNPRLLTQPLRLGDKIMLG